MNYIEILKLLQKTMSNPTIVLPLLKGVFDILIKIPPDDLKELYGKYPELQGHIEQLKLFFEK